ncbi:N-acetylmuramoyl-L-alanine amidase [Erwinia psidii]|uniref:N-acetylmuramoyl-L-alanine amidase n=1 Tax=Erwinia psidii TaxID=69224 RepID=A0A3N6SE98_9GAMM|nr:N-acetylmuramoyl-L-alanine amidase [Erwinia psidii]MCX8957360.1 N-acetylmuramoyl-L-alanine amidase [Erwinia psidii]MCX8964673.1 N-acetylmuramoyl-L-alanine amidase [Erwinia psidii]RQM38213.1 N-acetylmuramoyl-L-alanine amidase [Erwinia psidii]
MRLLLILAAILLLTDCAPAGLEKHNGYAVDTRHHAYGSRPRIGVLVLHYTAEDFPTSLATLTDREVSAHYLIPARPPENARRPVVFRLVPETQLAWHAGRSFWQGATRLNDTSIGIELENQGFRRTIHGVVWYPFPGQQIDALLPLLRDIIDRYHILPQNVVGHSDIAPQRKQDPGPLFPWQWLAERGVGAWPDAQRVTYFLAGRSPRQLTSAHLLLTLLGRYGYEVTPDMTPAQQQKVIAAFQMHFRPADYRGLADAQSEAMAKALLEKYRGQTSF